MSKVLEFFYLLAFLFWVPGHVVRTLWPKEGQRDE